MNKPTIESEYFYRLQEISKLNPENVLIKLVEFLKEVRPKSLRIYARTSTLAFFC